VPIVSAHFRFLEVARSIRGRGKLFALMNLSPSSVGLIWYLTKAGVQYRIGGLATLVGVWLRATETDIIAVLRPLRRTLGLRFYKGVESPAVMTGRHDGRRVGCQVRQPI